jgi:NADH:ubiquinone oxidoreductase subunit 6 (subunit J)
LLDNCRFIFGLHQLKTYHWRIHSTGEDYQSIKVLGKVLLNDIWSFEFASILLLVAMIGTVLLSKKKTEK